VSFTSTFKVSRFQFDLFFSTVSSTNLDSPSEACKPEDNPSDESLDVKINRPKPKKLKNKTKKKGSFLGCFQFSISLKRFLNPTDRKLKKVKKELKEVIKTIVCPQCPLKFDRPSHLEIHLRVHSGERPFACSEPGCGKSFAVKARYNAHVKLKHSLNRPHVCEVCDRGFVTAYQLEEHSNLHLAQKPYECPHCGKTFSLRGTMVSVRVWEDQSRR
jgi:uncharacterized Zn-finger protein